MEVAVEAVTAGYHRRRPVLRHFDLTVAAGEHVGLLGPSGAGKTTLFRILTRSLSPVSGRVLIGGRDLAALSGRDLRSTRALVGVVHQRGDLVPSLSALVNVAIALEAGAGPLGVLRLAAVGPSPEVTARCRAALDRLEVGHLATSRVDELSGGERQRVAVARLLVQAPRVVLADEPTASVDQRSATIVHDALVGLCRGGTTLFIATHDLSVAGLADRVTAIVDGSLVHDGPPASVDAAVVADIYSNPSRPASVPPAWARPSCP